MYQSTLPCDFALPAEWEPQSAIMLTWPHAGTDWKPYLPEISQTYLELADIITRYEHLLVATPDVTGIQLLLENHLNQEQMNRIHLYEVESNDTWARDHGPITMVLRKKQNTWMVPIRMLDFKFNGWGEKFRWEKDNAINLKLYYMAAFNADMENHQGFVLEGGSIESDGKGTLFTTSQCLLAPHRNQPLDHDSIDHLLKTFFHLKRVVWLDHGNLIGDDTDGHIDTIVRVAPNDTLLYVGCDDPEDEQYEDFQALEKQLQSLFTWEGYPYRLLKLPMPDPIFDEGDRLTTDKDSKRRGYVPADENRQFCTDVNVLPIDSIYTPIRNVKYAVEPYRVEQKTDYDKLVLEVTTDGSISPKDALKEAAKILIYHFMLFSDEKITLESPDQENNQEFDEEVLHMRQLLKTRLVDMNLSVRALNCLKAADVETLGDLVQYNKTDLLKFRNFGKKSLSELDDLLESLNLSFGTDISKYKLDKDA